MPIRSGGTLALTGVPELATRPLAVQHALFALLPLITCGRVAYNCKRQEGQMNVLSVLFRLARGVTGLRTDIKITAILVFQG